MSGEIADYKSLITEDLDWYETQLLAACIRRPLFYRQMARGFINKTPKDLDFLRPYFNDLYASVLQFYNVFPDGEYPEGGIPKTWFDVFLSNTNRTLLDDEIELCSAKIEEIYGIDDIILDPIVLLLKETFPTWTSIKAAEKTFRNFRIGQGTLSELTEEAAKHQTAVKSEMDLICPELLLDRKTSDIPFEDISGRVGTGFTPLDQVLHGGMGRGESCLFIIPSGGGKTVLATMISTSAAYAKRNILWVNTEEPPERLLSRMVSCKTGIPYDHFDNGGVLVDKLNDRQLAEVTKFKDRITGYLRIFNWSGSSKTIHEDLEAELIQLRQEHSWTPDVIVFDWLGGGISEAARTTTDRSQLALYYGQSVSAFDRLMKKLKVPGYLFAQADSNQSSGQKLINHTHMAVNKSLHVNMSAAVGVSALERRVSNKPAEDMYHNEVKEDVHERIQYMNPFKVRNAPAQYFAVEREFAYQRFKSAKVGGAVRR